MHPFDWIIAKLDNFTYKNPGWVEDYGFMLVVILMLGVILWIGVS